MRGIVSLAEPVPVSNQQEMSPRPRTTGPLRADDTTPVTSPITQKALKVPSKDSSKKSTAATAAQTASGISSLRKCVAISSTATRVPGLASVEKPPHITSQKKSKLAAARAEQTALAAKEAAKAMPIPKKSSKRRLSPPSGEFIVSPSSGVDIENGPHPSSSPKDSEIRSSGDTQKSQRSHEQMTVNQPNHEEEDGSIMIPSSNAAWRAVIEDLNSDSDVDSFTTASDQEVAEHGSIQIGLVRSAQPRETESETLRPPPPKTTRYKTTVESALVPLPGPTMDVQELGAPDTLSRCASLVTLDHSREAGLLFQSSRLDRKVRSTESKVLIHITGQPARIPKVPSKDEYKALVARGMREFKEYAANQDQRLPKKPRVPEKSRAPKPQKSSMPQESQPALRPQPLPNSQLSLTAQLFAKWKSPPKPEVMKDVGRKNSVKDALGAFKKRTFKALSLNIKPGPKRRSLAVLMQPQSVGQSVEDISAQVATGRGRPVRRDSRRESRTRLQKRQKSSGASNSPRTSRFFKRSSGSTRNSALRLRIHNRIPSLPKVAELEGEGPFYELAAFDADGNIPRDRSLSPIRAWNNGGATWLAADKRMNETSSTLALVPGVEVGNLSRRRDWAKEYRTAIAL